MCPWPPRWLRLISLPTRSSVGHHMDRELPLKLVLNILLLKMPLWKAWFRCLMNPCLDTAPISCIHYLFDHLVILLFWVLGYCTDLVAFWISYPPVLFLTQPSSPSPAAFSLLCADKADGCRQSLSLIPSKQHTRVIIFRENNFSWINRNSPRMASHALNSLNETYTSNADWRAYCIWFVTSNEICPFQSWPTCSA